MKRTGVVLLVILLASLAAAVPVLAGAPAVGTVHEGVGVPGIDLGFTRAQVEAEYGPPASCTNLPYYDGRQGLNGICDFDVDGGGRVTLHYFGAGGGPAQDSPDDFVFNIRWPEAVSGWVTTAGINTTLAKADPDAVVAAYPDAQVTYNSFGAIYSVVDAQQGIEIIWAPNFYNGTVHVSMAIFAPRPPAPQPVEQTRVESIDLTATKSRGQRQISALVRVQNEQGLAAAGATVSATWTLPDGSTSAVQGVTSSTGYVQLQLSGRLDRGAYLFTVDDVNLANHDFDRAGSVLSASIRVK